MSARNLEQYRSALNDLSRRMAGTAKSLEEGAKSPTGGGSGESGAPMHLGDIGSETYTQELNATLLEGEDALRQEVADALERLENGTFGTCESCEKAISAARLEAVPYARFCVPCAEQEESLVKMANLNDGRPAGWGSTFEHPAALANQRRAGEGSPTTASRAKTKTRDDDRHAAGTPGGGSAVGGLGGTNSGDGGPDDSLEDAMGSSRFDVATDADEPEPNDAYAGSSGGAVGGTPANNRSRGGKKPGKTS